MACSCQLTCAVVGRESFFGIKMKLPLPDFLFVHINYNNGSIYVVFQTIKWHSSIKEKTNPFLFFLFFFFILITKNE